MRGVDAGARRQAGVEPEDPYDPNANPNQTGRLHRPHPIHTVPHQGRIFAQLLQRRRVGRAPWGVWGEYLPSTEGDQNSEPLEQLVGDDAFQAGRDVVSGVDEKMLLVCVHMPFLLRQLLRSLVATVVSLACQSAAATENKSGLIVKIASRTGLTLPLAAIVRHFKRLDRAMRGWPSGPPR